MAVNVLRKAREKRILKTCYNSYKLHHR